MSNKEPVSRQGAKEATELRGGSQPAPAWNYSSSSRLSRLGCCFLILISASSFAQTNRQASSERLNFAALTTQVNVRGMLEQDAAFAQRQGQANGQSSAKPSSGGGLSLRSLGFPSGVTTGNAKEQALLNKRSHMLQIHQKLGVLTTIPMVASLFTGFGAKGHHGLPGPASGRNLHMALGLITTGMYWTTAYYAIRAPKVPGSKPYGLIRLHEALAWVHGTGMILTPILGAIAYSQLNNNERVHGIAKYHSWAAYTTVGAYGLALLSVTLKKF